MGKFVNTLRDYARLRIKRAKIELSLFAYRSVFVLFTLMLGCFFCGIAWVFFNIAVVHYVNALLKDEWVGYLLVAGLHAVLGFLVLLLMRRPSFKRLSETWAAHALHREARLKEEENT